MRATCLGSNPLTFLLRCTCGRRSLFDKKLWKTLVYLRCDKCGSLICYKTMRVIPYRKGSGLMSSDTEFSPEEIAEFGDIFAELDQAKAHYELAAQRLVQRGYRERAHKILGAAQVGEAQKSLLVQDWELAKGVKAA